MQQFPTSHSNTLTCVYHNLGMLVTGSRDRRVEVFPLGEEEVGYLCELTHHHGDISSVSELSGRPCVNLSSSLSLSLSLSLSFSLSLSLSPSPPGAGFHVGRTAGTQCIVMQVHFRKPPTPHGQYLDYDSFSFPSSSFFLLPSTSLSMSPLCSLLSTTPPPPIPPPPLPAFYQYHAFTHVLEQISVDPNVYLHVHMCMDVSMKTVILSWLQNDGSLKTSLEGNNFR